MLDEGVVKEFLKEELGENKIRIPKEVSKSDLVKTFCSYVEDDFYEWLKDNFKSFFNHTTPDWQWIKEKIHKQG